MNDMCKSIERKITPVSNIKTLTGQTIAIDHLNKRSAFVDLGTLLDKDIQISLFHKVKYSIQVHLVVSDTDGVGGDIGFRIPGLWRDVDIRAVTGQNMKSKELFSEREDGI